MQLTTGPFFTIFYQSHLETPAETGAMTELTLTSKQAGKY